MSTAEQPSERPLQLLALSANTEVELNTQIEKTATQLESLDSLAFEDFCHAVNIADKYLAHRVAVHGATPVALAEKLRAALKRETPVGVARGHCEPGSRPKLAFLFTGQGSQYAGMGKLLFETSPTFRHALERCDAALRAKLGRSLLEVIYPAPGTTTPLDETQFTQPALFAIEYALSELWLSWGVLPDYAMGHSVGEYAASCIAGVFSLEDGLGLIAERGRLMQAEPPGGGMAAISAPAEAVREALKPFAGRVAIAALNGPRQTVVSGNADDIKALLVQFTAAGTKTKELVVSHAFHSSLMEPMLDSFEQAAAKVTFAPQTFSLVSNLTGRIADPSAITQASYWRHHVREPVQFMSSMQTLADAGCKLFLEIGPNPVLITMGRACVEPEGAQWLGSLRANRDDWMGLLTSLAALYTSGVNIDWVGFDRDYS